ncbi:MAG: DarT1-associated NADAR antitoxin family protein [Cetobacterium sp.]|uniref:DarT1-associated NADAR antitoxin family protein n=1 Tax=Cetobacterium sp. TaxID=2071632 RepID=UPI003F2C835F
MKKEVGDKMAKRPVFISKVNFKNFVDEIEIEFQWFPGFSISQKQKSIYSLHENFLKEYPNLKILEISTKSEESLGVKLSAFNLMISVGDFKYSVESAFQGSKIFENGGPYKELFKLSSLDAKRNEKLKISGELIGFEFYKTKWELEPKSLFYDWLYINALAKNQDLAKEILNYDAFTDIEFNPKKSFNNQARAAALYVSLVRRGLLEKALENQISYKNIIQKVFEIYTPLKQLTFLE